MADIANDAGNGFGNIKSGQLVFYKKQKEKFLSLEKKEKESLADSFVREVKFKKTKNIIRYKDSLKEDRRVFFSDLTYDILEDIFKYIEQQANFFYEKYSKLISSGQKSGEERLKEITEELRMFLDK